MMLNKEKGMEACPFSVEVMVCTADDGSIRTRSLDTKPSSCLVDQEEPSLVPAGSHTDSDDSSSEDGDDVQSRTALTLHSSTKHSMSDLAVPTDDVGMYDCLSDQFSNLFCPADPHNRSAVESSKPENHQMATTCAEVSCSDIQIRDLFSPVNPGIDVFSSLQFWLTPSQEEQITGSQCHTPRNRSYSRKRKTSHIQRLWNGWHVENSIPLERSKSMPSEPTPSTLDLQFDVFYDSDPEQEHQEKRSRGDFLQQPKVEQHYRSRRPRSIETILENEVCSFDDYMPVPPTPRNSAAQTFNFCDRQDSNAASAAKHSSNHSFLHSPVTPSEFDLMHPQGEDYLRDFIQEVTNTRIQLVWHRHSMEDEPTATLPPLRAPLAVMGAFEVGAHLDNLVVQPKFTWSPAHEPNLDNRRINLSCGEPDSIELLSVIRVVKPTKLNRRVYPFARLDRTCCITTNDERFPYLVFEAPSCQERDWLVTALKMIVARLASIIIVRDEAMLLEFFTPYAALMELQDEGLMDSEEEFEEREDGPLLDSNGESHVLSYRPCDQTLLLT